MNNISLRDGIAIYHYLEKTFLYDTRHNFDEIALNDVEADIIESINSEHTLKHAWEKIAQDYAISPDDDEAKKLFDDVIADLKQNNLINEGLRIAPHYGERNKSYPFLVSLELTNYCNFRCSHCYKETDCCNSSFISMKAIHSISDVLSKKIYEIQLTGGEATLHPYFNDIVNALDVPSLTLLTNGSRLYKMDDSILHKLTGIQISLYGCTENEYSKYAFSNDFKNVCKGIKRASALDIELTVAIILRKSNLDIIEKYINLLQDLGVKDIRFGASLKSGRNKSSQETDWDITEQECSLFEQKVSILKDMFPKIHFHDFTNESPSLSSDSINGHYRIKCQAGTRQIAISENECVRPCVYLPESFFGIESLNMYLEKLQKGKSIEFDKCIHPCIMALHKEHRHLYDICTQGFEEY